MSKSPSRGLGKTWQHIAEIHYSANGAPLLYGSDTDVSAAVNHLEHHGRRGILTAAQMCLEASFFESTPLEEKGAWLDKARSGFERVVAENRLFSAEVDFLSIRALMHLGQFATTTHMALTGTLPSGDIARTDYERSLDFGVQSAESHARQHEMHVRQQDELRKQANALSQLGVILLGQRYTATSIGTDSWWPSLSLLSQGSRFGRVSSKNQGWDINVHTDLGEGPDLTYRVRLIPRQPDKEAGEDDAPAVTKAEDISLINVYNDLALGDKGHSIGCRPRTIIKECFAEYTAGDSKSTERLDKRTRSFTDALDGIK